MAAPTASSRDPVEYLVGPMAQLDASRRQADTYLTDEDAAELLGLEPKTIRVWRKTRGLPFLRLSSRAIRIRRSDLETWLDTMRQRRVVMPK